MRRFLLSILLLSAFLSERSQQVRPEFRVRVDGFFLNGEFDVSGNQLASSSTLAGIVAKPYVGVRFGKEHRLMG